MALERLQKILARAGVASRRAAEALIVAGRVRVDGRVVTPLGEKADARAQRPRGGAVGLGENRPLELLLELHGSGSIDNDDHLQFFFVPVQLHKRPLQPREDIPIDVADIIAGNVIAVIREFGAGPPLR